MKNKRVLVTGGAGFIGSHLCALLLEKKHSVVCIDNLSTGSKRNIEPLLTNENFHHSEGDCRDISFLKKISKQHFDEIYDLASPASVTYITKYPVEAATVNSVGLNNLLLYAKKQNAKFLFASSSETYGDPKEHPQKESYWGNVNPVGIRSGYDEGKRFGEALCMAYLRQFKLDTKIIRIFNTYGPHASPLDSRVIPRFVMQALKGEPLTVHGDGKQTRSLCYVSDLVNGMIAMMESTESGPINLGNPDEYTILKIAELIINATKSSSKIQFAKRPQDDPGKRKPDIALAKEKLHWFPVISFSYGLEKTIAYFREII